MTTVDPVAKSDIDYLSVNTEWDYLTDDLIYNSTTNDSSSVQSTDVKKSNFLINSRKLLLKLSNDESLIPIVFYEICKCAVQFPNRISNFELADFVNKILLQISETNKKTEISIEFLIILQSFSLNPIIDKNLEIYLITFIKLIKIDLLLKRKYLDVEFLKKCQYFPNFSKFSFKIIREKEYGFPIYSSIHECIDGYTKLISEIRSMFIDNDAFFKIDYFIQIFDRLISHFQLDTNRCFLLLINICSKFFNQQQKLCILILKKTIWWKNKDANNSINLLIARFLKDHNYNSTSSNSLSIPELNIITLLVKENLIDFNTVYNSLSPFKDEEMDKLYDEYKENLKSKVFKETASALALAAPLIMDDDEDDENDRGYGGIKRPSIQTERKDIENKENDKNSEKLNITEENNTNTENNNTNNTGDVSLKIATSKILNPKVEFLQYLLNFKSYNNSIFILSQYPYLPLLNTELSDSINNVMELIINDYYYNNIVDKNDFILFKSLSNNINDYELIKLQNNDIEGSSSDLPKINNGDDFIKIANEFLQFNGSNISKSVKLFTKICNIISFNLKLLLKNENKDEDEKEKWFQVYRKFIFPNLSLLDGNSSVIETAFNILLENFELSKRYNLYGEYLSVTVKTNLEIKSNHDIAEKKTRDILKRLSNTNASEMMRKLAKLTYSQPIACCNVFLQQVENYDNLSNLLSDSSRFFNSFCWDVLSFQILNRLTLSNRTFLQNDGLNYNQWINNLSEFLGKISERINSEINLLPVFLLIIKSLSKNSTDYIILLNELIRSMSGIQQINNLTSRQILLMNSETGLKKSMYMIIQDKRLDHTNESKKLLNVLIENNLINELFILIVTLSEKLIEILNQPLKLISQRIDDLSQLCHTFITIIIENLESENFNNNLLPIDELIQDFNVKPEWSFELWRKQIFTNIKNDNSNNNDDDDDELNLNYFNQLSSKFGNVLNFYEWDSKNKMNINLYLNFWCLDLYDIIYEDINYPTELNKFKDQLNGLSKSIKLSDRDPNFSKKQRKQLEFERTSLLDITKNFKDKNESKHKKHNEFVMKFINNFKNQFFQNLDIEDEESVKIFINDLLEYCLLPRLVHSSFDSIFVFKFIFLIHKLNTPKFSLIYLLNTIFSNGILEQTFYTLTSLQIENFGLFYSEILKKLNDWRLDKELYEKEAVGDGLIGMIPPNLKSKSKSMEDETDKEKDKDIPKALTHELFKRALFNWHRSILINLVKSLESVNYTTRNNSIIFLKNLLGVFPIIEDHCEIISSKLISISKDDKRQDLILSSNALISHITSKRNNWISMWDFYEMDKDEKDRQIEKRKLIKERQLKLNPSNNNNTLIPIKNNKPMGPSGSSSGSYSGASSGLGGNVKPYGFVGLKKTASPASSSSSSSLNSSTASSSKSSTKKEEDKSKDTESVKSDKVVESIESVKTIKITPSPGNNTPNEPKSATKTLSSPPKPATVSKTNSQSAQTKSESSLPAPPPPPPPPPAVSTDLIKSRIEEEKRKYNGNKSVNNGNGNNANNNRSGRNVPSTVPQPPQPKNFNGENVSGNGNNNRNRNSGSRSSYQGNGSNPNNNIKNNNRDSNRNIPSIPNPPPRRRSDDSGNNKRHNSYSGNNNYDNRNKRSRYN